MYAPAHRRHVLAGCRTSASDRGKSGWSSAGAPRAPRRSGAPLGPGVADYGLAVVVVVDAGVVVEVGVEVEVVVVGAVQRPLSMSPKKLPLRAAT